MPSTLHALLIAINNYPIPRHRLNGCIADRDALKNYLEQRFIANEEITLRLRTLTDKEATKKGVIDAFAHFDEAQPGDTCLLFFSGHGSQAPAPREFWHLDPSKMCQSMVCYDSRVGGKDLMDKELSHLIWKATNDKKLHFVAVFDCCHSGSITREVGATSRMAEASPMPTRLEDFFGYEEYKKVEVNGQIQLSPHRGEYIQLAASKDQETAKELLIGGKTRGIFTYHLIALLEQAGDQLSYADLLNALRLRIEGKVRDQTPQLISTDPADKSRRFLGGIVPAAEPYYTLNFNQGRWLINGGSVHGIPTDGGVLALEDGTDVQITSVGANRSEVGGMDGRDTSRTYKATVKKMAVTSIKVAYHQDAEMEGRKLIDQALLDYPSAMISWVDEPQEAQYLVHASQGALRLTLPGEERPLFRRVEGYEPENARVFLQDVARVARWRNLLDLGNPRTSLRNEEFSLQLYRVTRNGYFEDDTPVEEVNWQENPQFRYDWQGGKWEQPGFQLKITNRGDRKLFVSAINLEDNFKVSNRFLPMQELAPAKELAPKCEVWLTDVFKGYPYKTITLEVKDAYHSWGITEKKEYIKVFISTDPHLSTDFYNQEGLELDVKKADKGTEKAGREEQAQPDQPDWTTREIALTVVRPMEQQVLEAEQTISLLNKLSISSPTGFKGKVSLAPRSDAERSVDAPGADFMGLWGHQEVVAPYDITRGMNDAPPLNTLEIHDAEGMDSVTADTPLMIDLHEALAADEFVVPMGFDPESGQYYPLGLSDAEGKVHIESLPEASASGTRSLGGSIKIFFHKVVLSKLGYDYEHPQLAVAAFTQPLEENPEEINFDYLTNTAAVKDQVAKAQRIGLFIHGIIGDTLEMAKSAKRLVDEQGNPLPNPFDLVLTFDYENLNTPIEETAKLLGQKLAAVGLGPEHDKHLTVIAHSMGGLVSRWFIEKEGGSAVVQHLIQVGTPNAGSPWADVYELASVLLTRVVDGAVFLKPYIIPLALLGRATKQLFVTLQQMDPDDSAFLKKLNDGTDPGIPYTIIAGNTQLISVALEEKQQAALRRTLARFRQRGHYNALDRLLFKLANDIAVTVDSILNIHEKGKRQHKPVEMTAACDHISYFVDPAGLTALGKAVAGGQ